MNYLPKAEGESRYAPRLIKGQRLGDFGVMRIGVAVDVGESLSIGVHDLEAAV